MRPVRRTKEELRDPREELARGPAHPPPEAGGGERGKLHPRDGTPTKPKTGLQLLTKDFLKFWMVDIRSEGRG